MTRKTGMEGFVMESRPRKSYRETISTFFYDKDTGTVMRKDAKAWGRTLIYYLVFYMALIALFSICMVTFMQQFINPRVPRHQLSNSVIGTSPGLGFRPMPQDVKSTLIYYKGTSYSAYEYWEQQLVDFLSVYKKKGQTAGAGQNIFNCDFRSLPPPGKVCDVDIRALGPCIQENHFSFHKSSPCIFIKLNKIYGWRPEFYNDTQNLPAAMPKNLKDQILALTAENQDYANMVWVSCSGITPTDEESMGAVKYLPHPGFAGYFYPYMNAEGYLSPLVAIQLERPKTGIVINIECRAWAKNIVYSRRERRGSVRFELMIE